MGTCTGKRGGETWLELYAAHELYGYRFEKTGRHRQGSQKALPEMSLKKSIQNFKDLATYTANQCLSAMDCQYFNASKAATRRMDNFAIKQSCMAIRIKPLWDDEMGHKVASMILQAKGKLTANQKGAHEMGNLKLPI